MDVITLTKENLEKEHICCAISNNKDCQVAAKKAWIARQLDAGLMFKNVMSGENVLSNIFPRRRHGLPY